MHDSLHHKQLRHALVEYIRNKGITNEGVLRAIAAVPRHLFISPKINQADAYEDIALSIGDGQTISQPYTVAFQTNLLELNRHDKVLEIGTGSGYQAAVLFEAGAKVFTIERREKLHNATRQRLKELGYSGIYTVYGDGNEGIPEHAPYDKILITAAAPEIPLRLLSQLKPEGIMVVPVDGEMQRMLRVVKLSETEFEAEDHGRFSFVPMLPGKE